MHAPTLTHGWTASVPVGLLLEAVTDTQKQRFFHMSTNNLETNRQAIGGLAAWQCQRRMPAHIKRRNEAAAFLKHRRGAASGSHVCQARCGSAHGWHDEQVNIAEEDIELAAKGLAAKQNFGDRKAVETPADVQQPS